MTELAKVNETTAAPVAIDPMVAMIERLVMTPDLPLDRLTQMLDMKERLDKEAARAAHASAFARASADFPQIPLKGLGHNGKPYALLRDIVSGTRPALSENGLALNFSIETGDTIRVTARLSHKMGHVETVSIDLPRDTSGSKNAVQSIGSSQTYGQRYTAQAILGLSLGEDTEDDGNASGPKETPQKQYSWADTVTQDLPDNATPRDKAEAISAALVAQFRRMKGVKQIDNEWDRRATLIGGLEDKHNDLWGDVIEAYDTRRHELAEIAAEKAA